MSKAIVVLAIIAALSLCGELLGALLFFFQTGGLIYLPRESVRIAESRELMKYRQRLHPYFGFTGQYFGDFHGPWPHTNGEVCVFSGLNAAGNEELAVAVQSSRQLSRSELEAVAR
jgi:hypothetical protein